jgi:uncharacterized membrane protein
MIKILQAAYPAEGTIATKWRKAILMGSFVFLFLYFFQPFGLNTLPSGIFELTLGYGLTCFITMAFLNVLIPTIFQHYFSEKHWNVGRQLFWSIVNVAIIGLSNLLYSNYVGIANLSIGNLLIFESYTIALTIFPLILFIFGNQKILNNKFEKSASLINSGIIEFPKAEKSTIDHLITLESETKADNLILDPNDLVYIQSTDNYLTVFYLKNNQLTSTLIRNTLKTVDEQLKEFSVFFRCHKSYLINLEKVNHISGNAQGFKLHLQNIEELIPVSRSHNNTIKERLTIHP